LNMTLMPAIASSALPRAMLIPCPPQSQKTARVAEPSGLVFVFSRQRPIHFPGENAKFGQKLNGSRLIHTDGQSGGRSVPSGTGRFQWMSLDCYTWERRAFARQLLLYDSAAWLLHCGVTPSAELRQER
jgi:hypothetical protein